MTMTTTCFLLLCDVLVVRRPRGKGDAVLRVVLLLVVLLRVVVVVLFFVTSDVLVVVVLFFVTSSSKGRGRHKGMIRPSL